MKNNKLAALLLILIILFHASCTTKQNGNNDTIEIPFTLEKKRIVIEAMVNQKKGRFIFDTGATESYLDINVDNLTVAFNTLTTYEGERTEVLAYNLPEITFGEHTIKANSWVVNRSDIITRLAQSDGFDGLMGVLIFEGYWCELSFSKSKIILHKKKPDYAWHNANAKILFGKHNTDFFIPVEIDGKNYYFDLDTGSPGGIYCPDTIIVGKTPTEYCRVITRGDWVNNFYLIKTDSVTILDETYRDKIVPADSVYSTRVDAVYHNLGLLGIDFMQYYDFLFDFTDLRKGKTTGLYYNPISPVDERDYDRYVFVDNVPEFGIWHYGYDEEKGLTVYRVIEDSPAYEDFHVRPRMIITKINGEKINQTQAEQLVHTTFYQEVKDYSYISFEREGRVYTLDEVEQRITVKTEDKEE